MDVHNSGLLLVSEVPPLGHGRERCRTTRTLADGRRAHANNVAEKRSNSVTKLYFTFRRQNSRQMAFHLHLGPIHDALAAWMELDVPEMYDQGADDLQRPKRASLRNS